MMERTQWILALCTATFIVVVAIALLLLRRPRLAPDQEAVIRAIDGNRVAIDAKAEVLEAMNSKLDKANGRLQFLMAEEIAEELAAFRADVAKIDDPPSKDKPPS